MTQDEAIAIARQVATSEGWPWCEPIEAMKSRRFVIAGAWYWHILSNANYRHTNVYMCIDDETKSIISKRFALERAVPKGSTCMRGVRRMRQADDNAAGSAKSPRIIGLESHGCLNFHAAADVVHQPGI
ncbi:MAG: hypothetical protein JWP89_5318 [Schlesneria sp.]|nr:hypothetical protein [Schlesneria sp.]